MKNTLSSVIKLQSTIHCGDTEIKHYILIFSLIYGFFNAKITTKIKKRIPWNVQGLVAGQVKRSCSRKRGRGNWQYRRTAEKARLLLHHLRDIKILIAFPEPKDAVEKVN